MIKLFIKAGGTLTNPPGIIIVATTKEVEMKKKKPRKKLNWNRERYAECYLRDGKKTVVKITSRNLLSLAGFIPAEAHSFILFDIFVATIRVDDRDVSLKSEREDISPKYFYGGCVYDRAKMQAEEPEYYHRVMSLLPHDHMVKNRFGEFRPFADGDKLIELKSE